MIQNLCYKNERTRDVYDFLNIPAIDFYSGSIAFDDPNYPMVIKGLLLQCLNHVERTLKGKFNCDLFLRGINNNNRALKQMFPVGCHVLMKEDIGEILNSLRNINAHARLSEKDLLFFKKKSFLNELYNLPRINDGIKTVLKGSVLTMGGLITLIMLFLRKESIELVGKRSKTIDLITSGRTDFHNASRFIELVSKTNLETPIREKCGDTIISSIFGEYENKIKKENDSFTLEFGTSKNPLFRLEMTIDEMNNVIHVKKGSLTKTYYNADYTLKIEDKDAFIETASMFPPFELIDLLFEKNIMVFGKNTRDEIIDKKSFYGKLNYPKFYVDKNIHVLLLPPTNSDFRIVSSLITVGLIDFFLKFEEDTYREYHFEKEGYSKVYDAFSLVGYSDELIEKLIVLRNFAMHGYVFNEYQIRNNVLYQYNFDFVVDTLRDALVELKEKNKNLLEKAQDNIEIHIIRPLLNGKYSKIIEYSLDALQGHPEFNPNEQSVKNKMLYVLSSFFDTEDLNRLFVSHNPIASIDEYHIEGEETYFLQAHREDQKEMLESYLNNKENTYTEVKTEDKGIIRIHYLVKD